MGMTPSSGKSYVVKVTEGLFNAKEKLAVFGGCVHSPVRIPLLHS